jgi:hypothetical protein
LSYRLNHPNNKKPLKENQQLTAPMLNMKKTRKSTRRIPLSKKDDDSTI